MTTFSKGDRVRWAWGAATAEGVVVESLTKRVTRSIKGTKVTRNASAEEPAYLIRQNDGDRVLKSASELKKA
jgi:hypothetical protein